MSCGACRARACACVRCPSSVQANAALHKMRTLFIRLGSTTPGNVAKDGQIGTHPLLGDELRALRALKRDATSPFIFVSEAPDDAGANKRKKEQSRLE